MKFSIELDLHKASARFFLNLGVHTINALSHRWIQDSNPNYRWERERNVADKCCGRVSKTKWEWTLYR